MRIIRQNVDYDVARRGIERGRHARRNYSQQPQTTATRNLFRALIQKPSSNYEFSQHENPAL